MKYIIRIIFKTFDLFCSVTLKNRVFRVESGPFKGMHYVAKSIGSSLIPKILGTYESEIHELLQNFPRFDLGLDVGAAEGYYAIGLIHSGMCRNVIAWEITSEGRHLCKQLAEMNKASDHVEIRGECIESELISVIDKNSDQKVLLITDCEGFESVFFNENTSDHFRYLHIIIETHDFICPGIHKKIRNLLTKTHRINEVFPIRKSFDKNIKSAVWPLSFLARKSIWRLSTSERRSSGNGWLICSPNLSF